MNRKYNTATECIESSEVKNKLQNPYNYYANSIKDLSTQKSSRKQKNDEDNGIMLFNRGITIKKLLISEFSAFITVQSILIL